MLKLFRTPRPSAEPVEADPLAHPQIARMSLRELADLPFPRAAPVAGAEDRLCGNEPGAT